MLLFVLSILFRVTVKKKELNFQLIRKKKEEEATFSSKTEAGPQEVQNDIKHVILVLFAVLNTITFLFLKKYYILSVHLSLG